MAATDNSHHAPPPLPPLKPVDYLHHRPGTGEWLVVASFPTIAAWYVAKAILDGHRILSRIGHDADNPAGADLLVLASEAEWAQEVLKVGILNPVGPALPVGGFTPVIERQKSTDLSVTDTTPPDTIKALPVAPLNPPQLPSSQRIIYSVAVWLLWIVMLLGIGLLVFCMTLY